MLTAWDYPRSPTLLQPGGGEVQGGSMVLSAEFGKQTLGIPGIFA